MSTLENIYNNSVKLTVYSTSVACMKLDDTAKKFLGYGDIEIRLQQQGRNMKEENTKWNGKMVVVVGDKNFAFNMEFLKKNFDGNNNPMFLSTFKGTKVGIDRYQFKEICKHFVSISNQIGANIA